MKKTIIILISIILGIGLIAFLINEALYFNWVKFLLPIDCKGEVLIRKDARGDGDFSSQRNGQRKHAGLDISAAIGTPVRAMRSGIVINAEYKRGIGNYVEIRHLPQFITIYAHLSKIYVKKNQRVRQGQIVGEVGKTGNANYRNIHPHIHFEIREDCVPQDPKQYFTNTAFSKEK